MPSFRTAVPDYDEVSRARHASRGADVAEEFAGFGLELLGLRG